MTQLFLSPHADGGDVEAPDMGDWAKPSFAGPRIHRHRLDAEIMHIVGDTGALLLTNSSIKGGTIEEDFDWLNATKCSPHARIASDTAATALVNECLVLQRLIDAVEVVVNR